MSKKSQVVRETATQESGVCEAVQLIDAEAHRVYSLNDRLSSHNTSLWSTDSTPPCEVAKNTEVCWYQRLLNSIDNLKSEVDIYETLVSSVEKTVGIINP